MNRLAWTQLRVTKEDRPPLMRDCRTLLALAVSVQDLLAAWDTAPLGAERDALTEAVEETRRLMAVLQQKMPR